MSSDSKRSMLEHPTPEQLKEYGSGRAPGTRFTDLEQHLLECPECLRLLEQFSSGSLVQKIRNAEQTDPQPIEVHDSVYPAPLKLTAGYEIREEIGRGGMGIVYRAWQPGLGRNVALKRLLNADMAGRKALERFRNEATILGTINHPCIVDVYDVGEQDGQPYIAMELVDGITLAEELREKVLDSNAAAELLVQLADAVAAANEQGIIHRDLKPQNVLITRASLHCSSIDNTNAGSSQSRAQEPDSSGEAERAKALPSRSGDNGQMVRRSLLVPKLVDFGLSRLHSDGKQITETAELLGTPGYMAPEQLRPEETITQAADVYGLGAILYQCLTGRAPFQGATALETIAMIQSSDILPIAKLRRDVSRDLQVICHHCLEKEPNHRYASAAALRDDLRRFLEGRPIHAKPPGFMRKLVLWTGRNKAVAGLSLTILAGIILGAGLIAAYQNRLRIDRDHANRRYADARASIWRMIDSASSQSIFDVPKLQELLSTQAHESMALFEQLAREEGTEQALLDLARLRMLLGTIAIAQGKPAEGEALLRKATEAIANISISESGTEELMKMAIAGQVKLATSLFGQGKTSAALEVLTPAKKYAEVLINRNPDSPDNLNQLAWIHHVAGSARIGVGDFAAAKEDLRLAVELRNKALEKDARNVGLATYLAGSLVNLALCESSLGNHDQSLAGYRQAIQIMKTVQPLDPKSSGIALVVAGARLNASNILAQIGKGRDAADLLTEGIRELQPYLDAAPNDFQFREYMFKLFGNRAMYSDKDANPVEVIADWKRAIELANREEDRQFCRDQLKLREANLAESTNNGDR